MSTHKFNFRSEKILGDLKQGKRPDERKLDEYRKIQVLTNISQNADGSARVKLGETDVFCGIKFGVAPPFPDSPAEGTISVMAELLALASPDFEAGPPNEDSVELARVVDRAIREGKCIDFKTLSITEGELCWVVFVDLYIMNHDGNLFDASSIAALAALKEARFPKLEGKMIVKGEYTKKLKLDSNPLLSTFGKAGATVFLDPSLEEEKAMTARLSIGVTEDDVCAMQKGGSGSFSADEVNSAIDMAFKNSKVIRKML
ncbi:MAG: exosome complex protein Rrp42 [Candidatus Diapherotrites archaeon]|nr:exosome complex protein Rrp42 [Candidatus Diapherotrites archaeon]